jgi:glucosyl-3-phosphoglycerate synthase
MDQSDWRTWFQRSTFGPPDPDLNELTAAKRRADASISVCLPARNEGATVGDIVRSLGKLKKRGLVDEIIVSDSGSEDDTVAQAAAAGARLVQEGSSRAVPRAGKGGAMWRGAAAASGDILCFLDSDVLNFGSHYVTRLIAPLIADPSLVMVKAFYERPITKVDGSLGPGGARVTELAMRPLVQILYPTFTGVVQPLAGECAIRRKALREIRLVSGYGVEAGMLVDVVQRFGIESLAQSDLGIRVHRNRRDEVLGETAFQVIEGLLMRLEDYGLIKLPADIPNTYVRFDQRGKPESRDRGVFLLPPLSGPE